MSQSDTVRTSAELTHAPSGIAGLDEVTDGGLPRGRATLVCGGPGTGKTLFGIQFLVAGALTHGEPGVLISFEQTPDELAADVAALGWDLGALVAEHRLSVDFVDIRRGDIDEAGAYDLGALFVRLDLAISAVGARRVVLDTPEAMFSAFDDTAALRSEIRRLFRWLRERGITTVVTAEAASGAMTRHGFEEFVSDAVIVLDHRVNEQMATRRLRIVKFRGSSHATNEFPFLIDRNGFSVIPITTFRLDYDSPTERVSSGTPMLDDLFGGSGFFRASSVMVSGSAGTGKSTIAARFVAAAAARGERALYLAFEESPAQIVRNMRSVGVDMAPAIADGRIRIAASRPTQNGLEGHLTTLYQAVETFRPDCVAMDPITDFQVLGGSLEIKAMLMRMVDTLKTRGITALFTAITADLPGEQPSISSLIDTWIQLAVAEEDGERRRRLYILKSRGMSHSNRVAPFEITDDGPQPLRGRRQDNGDGGHL